MSDHNNTGARGEELAVDYLERDGYEILRRNFKYGRYEIDIIAVRDDWLLFIEVKTRSNLDYGTPEEFVLAGQSTRIMRAAEEFILTTNWQGHVRFDIISVVIGDRIEITHFEDAIN
ncbi:MAG: YraN family protein [Chryseolinea sp.]